MKLARDELLQVGTTAYGNIVELGIGGELAPAGYPEERRLAGLQLVAGIQDKLLRRQNAQGEQYNITQTLNLALADGRQEMIGFKEIVRTADAIAPPAEGSYYTQLGLKGKTPTSLAGLATLARTVYSAVLDMEDLLPAISGFGYTQERVNQLLQSIDDLEELNGRQEKAKADSQALTGEIQVLEEALWDDLGLLKRIVRALYSGEREEQVLDALQLGRV